MKRQPNYHDDVILPVRAVLAERFPLAFMPKGWSTKLPLKIGIFTDIVDRVPDIDPIRLKHAVSDYCSGPKYARCVVAGALRVDLDGNPAGEVTPGHEAHAQFKEKGRAKRVLNRQRAANERANAAKDVAA